MRGCFRGCSCLGLLLVAFLFMVCVGEPTVVAVRERARIADAIEQAKSIEVIKEGRISVTRKLARSEFDGMLRAMPLRPDIGVWGFEPMLRFYPGFKIIATNARGKETIIAICDRDDQFRINDGPILPLPYMWRQSLRDYFTKQGLPFDPIDPARD